MFIYFIIVVVIIVLIINNDKKSNEKIDLQIELIKEKIKQSKEYKKYKKMDFYEVYDLKEQLLHECKEQKDICNRLNRNAWKVDSFLEKYARLDLLNDLALEKYNSDENNDDIYIFDINLDN